MGLHGAAWRPARHQHIAELARQHLFAALQPQLAAGRNLAVLVEAAVRNEILKLRGIDSTAEFLARQRSHMDKSE